MRDFSCRNGLDGVERSSLKVEHLAKTKVIIRKSEIPASRALGFNPRRFELELLPRTVAQPNKTGVDFRRHRTRGPSHGGSKPRKRRSSERLIAPGRPFYAPTRPLIRGPPRSATKTKLSLGQQTRRSRSPPCGAHAQLVPRSTAPNAKLSTCWKAATCPAPRSARHGCRRLASCASASPASRGRVIHHGQTMWKPRRWQRWGSQSPKKVNARARERLPPAGVS